MITLGGVLASYYVSQGLLMALPGAAMIEITVELVGMNPSYASAMQSVLTAGWYVKPLYGCLIDCGHRRDERSRRRCWRAVGGDTATCLWIVSSGLLTLILFGLSLSVHSTGESGPGNRLFALLMTGSSVVMAAQDVAVDGVMACFTKMLNADRSVGESLNFQSRVVSARLVGNAAGSLGGAALLEWRGREAVFVALFVAGALSCVLPFAALVTDDAVLVRGVRKLTVGQPSDPLTPEQAAAAEDRRLARRERAPQRGTPAGSRCAVYVNCALDFRIVQHLPDVSTFVLTSARDFGVQSELQAAVRAAKAADLEFAQTKDDDCELFQSAARDKTVLLLGKTTMPRDWRRVRSFVARSVDVLVLGGGAPPPEDALAVMASRARVYCLGGESYPDNRSDRIGDPVGDVSLTDRLHRDADTRDRFSFWVLTKDGAREFRNWFRAVRDAPGVPPRIPKEPPGGPSELASGSMDDVSLDEDETAGADAEPGPASAPASEATLSRIRFCRMASYTFLTAVLPSTGSVTVYYLLDNTDLRPAHLTVIGAVGSLFAAAGAWAYSNCATLSNIHARTYLFGVSFVIMWLTPVDWRLIQKAPELSLETLLVMQLLIWCVWGLLSGTTGPVISHATASAAIPDRETTSFSILMTLNNCGVGLSGVLSTLLASSFGIKKGSYGENFMPLVVGVGLSNSVLNLALLFLPPLESHNVSGGGYGVLADREELNPVLRNSVAERGSGSAEESDEESKLVSAGDK